MTNEHTPPPDDRQPETASRMGNIKKLVALVLIIVVAVGTGTLLTVNHHLVSAVFGGVENWVREAGPWGGLIIIVLMVVHSIVFFPLEVLAVIAGATYGFWWGSLYMWVGAMLASAMCFYISRQLGRPFMERLLKPHQLEKLDQWSENSGTLALIVTRLLPVVSFNLVNYGAGLTNVGWWKFLWTTAIGCIPVLCLSVLFGVGLDALPLPYLLLASALAIAAILVFHWYAKRRGWIKH